MSADRVLPILIRARQGLEILVFDAGEGGVQLVRSIMDDEESPAVVAVDTLLITAGIAANCVADLGDWSSRLDGQEWLFMLCVPTDHAEDEWTHPHPEFPEVHLRYRWLPLHEQPEAMHPIFQNALSELRRRVPKAMLSLAQSQLHQLY